MSVKRNTTVLIIILFIFAGLILRFFYLQAYSGKKLARAASFQRMADAEVEKPRGDILDRNNIPLTNRDGHAIIVLKPFMLKGKEDELKDICRILDLDYNRTKREVEMKREPVTVQSDLSKKDAVLSLGIDGVSVLNTLQRYGGSSVAKHVLGYLNRADQVGETGIEKFYEDVLGYKDRNIIGVITDARKNEVQGLGYRILAEEKKNKKLNVKLTLNYHMQKIVEDVMEKNQINGAVVIEDAVTGDILAMASKPDYDPNDVGSYLHSSQNELFNRAVASYNLGSIFKIVDVAQALESGTALKESYYCDGSVVIGDKEFRCSAYEKGGHGEINFTEAFSQSCNPYFIELGIRLGFKNIVEMAKRFGLGSATGIKEQGVDESAGMLPDPSRLYTDGDTANIAIGQGNILATPVQVADLIATVANGGIKNRMNIVDSIVDSQGNKVRNVRKKEGTRIISKETAEKIKRLMEEVTVSGTGTRAGLNAYGGSGGKTGSAEAVVNGRKAVHAWFGGYFPKKDPKYSVAVFIEDGKSGGQAAAPIFEEIAEEIIRKGL